MSGLELRILSGLHRGAALPLSAEPLTIGSSEACDVVLVDEGIAPEHAILRAWEDGYSLDSQGGKVLATDGSTIALDMPLKPGICVALGLVWICVDLEERPWPDVPKMPVVAAVAAKASKSKRIKPWLIAGGGALTATLLLGLTGFASPSSSTASAVHHANADHPLAKPEIAMSKPPAIPSVDTTPARANDESLRNLFRHRLDDAKLLPHLDAQLDDTEWNLRGDLDAEEMTRLEHVLGTFVTEHHITFPVHAKVIPAEQMLPFHIRQFQGGINASVSIDDGRRLYVGDSYRGYRLQDVRENELVFDGPRQIVVRW